MPIQSSSGNSNHSYAPTPANEAGQIQPFTEADEDPRIASLTRELFYRTIQKIEPLVDELKLTANETVGTLLTKVDKISQFINAVNLKIGKIPNSTKLEEVTKAKLYLKAFTLIVQCFEELDKKNPSFRQKHEGLNDETLADYLITIFMSLRQTEEHDEVNYRNLREMFDKEGVDFCSEIILDKADKVFKNQSDQLTILRRAFKLDPDSKNNPCMYGLDGETLLNEFFSINTEAIAATQISLMSNLVTLSKQDSILEKLIGKEVTDELCDQISVLADAMRNSPMKDPERMLNTITAEELRLPLVDIGLACLDFIDFAINNRPSAKIANQSLQARQICNRLDRTIAHCVQLADVIENWKSDNPPPPTGNEAAQITPTKSVPQKPGSFISVVAPSGMRMSAKVDEDGTTARTIDKKSSFVYQISDDGRWHLVEDSGSEDLSETEISSESDSNDDTVANALPKQNRQYSNAVKAVKNGHDLLAPDFDKEYRNVTQLKRNSDPDRVLRSYELLAEKWNARSEKMRLFAEKLEKYAKKLSEDEKNTIDGWDNKLPTLLTQQAERLEAKALELTSQSKKWSLFKDYARPQAKHWQELLQNRQILVGKPKALKSNPPNTLFEIRLEARPDAHKQEYSLAWAHVHTDKPISANDLLKWAHVHTDKPISANDLLNLESNRFKAHIKSDKGKNLGQKWFEFRRRLGLEADVHRSPFGMDFLKELLCYENDS